MIKTIFYKSEKDLEDIIVRSQLHYDDINHKVASIIENIRLNGDSALLDYTEQFDKVKLNKVEVSADEIEQAYACIEDKLKSTLELACKNISDFHRKQLRENFFTHEQEGVILGQIFNPIEKVGIYVPGGTAAYPSTVLMNVIPAKIAGVSEIILVSPPGKNGRVPDAILAAAKITGVNRVFSIGGAQAIAALAYGTQSVPKVYKITGPGNIFVAAAKRHVFGEVGIDMFAGPSEILIVADASAQAALLAADMLSQAEHDPMASAVLVTTNPQHANEVSQELEKQLRDLPRESIARSSIENNGRIVVVETMEQAVNIANKVAPEHLELCVNDPFALLGKIKNAGSIFMGHYSPEPLGDYLAGPNHTLPTSGTPTFSSPLSVDDFIKKSSIIYYTKNKLEEIKEHVVRFAETEGLHAHAKAVSKRFETKSE